MAHPHKKRATFLDDSEPMVKSQVATPVRTPGSTPLSTPVTNQSVNTMHAGRTPHPTKKAKTFEDYRPSDTIVSPIKASPVKEITTTVTIRKFFMQSNLKAILIFNAVKLRQYLDEFTKVKYKKGTRCKSNYIFILL
jgi:hypothetical protein